jgi:phosphoethanolamine N-methyltransferase
MAGGHSGDFQKFLDTQQYNRKGILVYECIFGKTYVSTGGQSTTTKFCQRLDLKPDQKILDIGCGIGGSAFYLARQYGAQLYGVDLSTNMIRYFFYTLHRYILQG